MSSWSPTKYKTWNWPSYNTALKQRGSLSIWFDPEMSWHAPPTGKRGRQREFSDAAVQACLTMKVLFGMPLRHTSRRARRISPPGERKSPLKTRFVQQSRVSLKALLRQYAIKGNKIEVIAREGDTTDLQISIQSLQNVAHQSKAAFFDFTSRS